MKFALKVPSIFHHALSMLLHYLGKLKVKFAAKLDENAHFYDCALYKFTLHYITKCTNFYMHTFYCISLTYLLITSVLLPFLVAIKYSLKWQTVLCQHPQKFSTSCTLCMCNCMTSHTGSRYLATEQLSLFY